MRPVVRTMLLTLCLAVTMGVLSGLSLVGDLAEQGYSLPEMGFRPVGFGWQITSQTLPVMALVAVLCVGAECLVRAGLLSILRHQR